MNRLVLVTLLALCLATPAAAGAVLTGEEAPEWRIEEWINGDPGAVGFHKGRVLVLHFFQLWCPGCNEFSIPLMQRWQQKWGDREDFMIVSIHTVFEGHEYQSTERLRRFLRRNGIWYPVGVDAYAHAGDEVPVTMQRFGNTGTPQVALIDKEGLLVFNHFGRFDVATVEFLVERLLKTKSDVSPPPKPAVGRDAKLSGTYKLQLEQIANSCGALAAPTSMNVQAEVITDFIDVRFPQQLLGSSALTLQYNSRTLKLNATERAEQQAGGGTDRYTLTVLGAFIQGSRPPELSITAVLRKQSTEAGQSCMIKTKGSAVRIGE
jgi:thiol-disulfide isomerase/thioredoxin